MAYATDMLEGYHNLKVITAMISPISPGYSIQWFTENFKSEHKYDHYVTSVIYLLLLLMGWLTYWFTSTKETRLLQMAFAVVLINAILNILVITLAFGKAMLVTWPIAVGVLVGRCMWVWFSYKALQAIRSWNTSHTIQQPADTVMAATTIDRIIHMVIDVFVICFMLTSFNLVFFRDAFMVPLYYFYYKEPSAYQALSMFYNYKQVIPFVFFTGLRILYYLFFEYAFAITPGKIITDAYVLQQKGGNISFLQACIRTIARFMPGNFITVLDNGLHDHWSKSKVVKHKKDKRSYIWLLMVVAIMVVGIAAGKKLVAILYKQEIAINAEQIKKLKYAGIQQELKLFDTSCYLYVQPLQEQDYDAYSFYKVITIGPDSILFHAYKPNEFDSAGEYKNIIVNKQAFENCLSSFEEWKKGIPLSDPAKKHIIESVHNTNGPLLSPLRVMTSRYKPDWLTISLVLEHWQHEKIRMFLLEGQVADDSKAFSEDRLTPYGKNQRFSIDFKRNDNGVFKSYFVFTTDDGREYKFLVTNIARPNFTGGYTQINRMYP
ncbi:Uncharacterized membrane protein YckC, RDD family [Filimonas lacunae]|uniref:Uncharacterized membrane protein YckC, RDD family n=2 Tax=Filimonas lacunae TaxID=477680 RepID=A0A1N7R0I4_9BACT|nr:Uncharacterized membrane protein YckC, RDD family [Filimonas lacunae]